MIAIQTENLTKSYKNRIAVNDLNLSVNHGELFALLGINGAGKTTTIKMLSCLVKPTKGDALILGNSIVSNSFKVKEIINVAPQEIAISPNLSVRENLELMAQLYGNDRKSSKEKVNEIIFSFGLMNVAGDKASILSGGWKRRLNIAMALISEPQVLFLDEPTIGLDVFARRELWGVIKEMKGRVTIMLTTHYLEEAVSLADRIGIMVKGELKEVGTAKELMEKTGRESFEDAFIAISSDRGAYI